jgi:hypothetical protein
VRRPDARVAENTSEIADLLNLCRCGRLYAVERWLAAGRPVQVAHCHDGVWSYAATPLSVAIESRQYDLAFLLLCNGYRTDLEPQSPLNLALRKRGWDYLDLLLEWGADPKAADPDAVLDTYQVGVMDRFWDLGLDLTRDDHLAYYLAQSSSNKPAYGWAKRHNADPRVARALTLALGEAVWENREKAVALLVWAGADPHLRVPSLRYPQDEDEDKEDDEGRSSAIEHAVMFGRGKLVKYLKPDPERDDFEGLWAEVSDPETADLLFDRRPPRDWSKAIERNIWRIGWWYWDRSDHRACLERIFEHFWGRLSTLSPRDCQEVRRGLLKIASGSDLGWVLGKLAKPQHCDQRIFRELVRTPAIRQKMASLGLSDLLPSRPARPRAVQRSSPKQKQEEVRAEERQEEEWLRSLSAKQRATVLRDRITREQLYAEIWAEPAIKVAERYGVSDVAVAKWCRRLGVPRPGRGYWACQAAGQAVRQPPLPERRRGDAMYVHRPEPRREKPPAPAAVPGLDRFPKPIPIPEAPEPEHDLVAQTRRALAEAEADEYGLVRPFGSNGLDVYVGPGSVNRTLRIMSAIVRALEGAGFGVGVCGDPDRAGSPTQSRTFAVLGEERVPFALEEATERVERPPNDQERAAMRRNSWTTKGPFYSHHPTGQLSLQIEGGLAGDGRRRSWSDSRLRRLEGLLHSFIRGLLVAAEAQRRRRQGA